MTAVPVSEAIERSLLTSVNSQLPLPKMADSESADGGAPRQCKLPQSTAEFSDAQRTIAEAFEAAKLAPYLAASLATSTRSAYRADLADFLAWGGLIPASPQMLASYAVARAQIHRPATVLRRIVGIARAHTAQGLDDPSKNALVKTVCRGMRRIHGTAQRQASPLLRDDLFPILSGLRGVRGLRDRALLLLGFAGAFRRSELVSLNFSDVEHVPEGLLVRLARSKTDQEGAGIAVAIPRGRTSACPVTATSDWLSAACITTGPVFRSVDKKGRVGTSRLSAQSVSLIVKANAHAIGLPAERFSSHSLRAGLVTSAARQGVSLSKIQEQSRHSSLEMVGRYVRDAMVFENNAAGALL